MCVMKDANNVDNPGPAHWESNPGNLLIFLA